MHLIIDRLDKIKKFMGKIAKAVKQNLPKDIIRLNEKQLEKLKNIGGIILGLAAVAAKGAVAVLEELTLPVVEDTGSDAVLVAQLGDRDFFEEMTAQDGDLLLGAEILSGGFGHSVFLRS